jgi:hypothetical protein
MFFFSYLRVGLPIGLLTFKFPFRILCSLFISSTHPVSDTNLIKVDLITVIFCEENKSSCSLRES